MILVLYSIVNEIHSSVVLYVCTYARMHVHSPSWLTPCPGERRGLVQDSLIESGVPSMIHVPNRSPYSSPYHSRATFLCFVGDVGTASEHCLLASSRRGYYNSVALTEVPFTCLLRKLLLRLVVHSSMFRGAGFRHRRNQDPRFDCSTSREVKVKGNSATESINT